MRIAIPFYQGLIFQHFGHAPQFKIYEIENRQVLMEMIVEVEDKGHDSVTALLRSLDVRVVICGSIGEGAMQALQGAGIVFYGGVTGDADAAITALIQGGLKYDPNVKCTAHADGHACGDCSDCGDCGGDCAACGH
jgi:predicted Fe-Mo cluster-binding NifX family protein